MMKSAKIIKEMSFLLSVQPLKVFVQKKYGYKRGL